MSNNEYKALIELKNNTDFKGTTTVIMNKCDKIQENEAFNFQDIWL